MNKTTLQLSMELDGWTRVKTTGLEYSKVVGLLRRKKTITVKVQPGVVYWQHFGNFLSVVSEYDVLQNGKGHRIANADEIAKAVVTLTEQSLNER